MELATIFRRYSHRYLELYQGRIPKIHLKALNDISNCRTDAFGGHIDRCDHCGYVHFFHHSCYNRSCPKCQGIHTQKWLEKRKAEMLPLHYFHMVFTIPQELYHIVHSKPKQLLDVLIKAAAQSLKKLMADPKYGGGKPGFITVLHTWTRSMEYHPHVHILVAAVVIANSDSSNRSKEAMDTAVPVLLGKKFLVPIFALSDIFRAIFIKMARKKLPDLQFPQSIWKKRWVVYCKPTLKGGTNVIQYLARYVYRIAITNNRILADHDGKITFKYQACKDYKWKKLTLDAMKFMRRFLQHVLPPGVHKVRYYGFLAPGARHTLHSLRAVLNENITAPQPSQHPQSQSHHLLSANNCHNYRKCPICKIGNMVVIKHFFYRKYSSFCSRPPP